MTTELRRMVRVGIVGFAAAATGLLPQTKSAALDTPNALMGIDAMVLRAGGIFRDPGSFGNTNGNDGYNTFQFGGFNVNNSITTGYGKYDAVRFQKNQVGDCCISHNARFHSDTPESIVDASQNPPATAIIGGSITSDFLPIVNRAAFGQRLDADQYQIEVKFKPLLTLATANTLGTNPYPSNPSYPNITAGLENTAPLFTVGVDLLGGYVWDAEASSYKRADEGITYNIGSTGTPINTWYATAPHDADGFATFTVPITSPSFIQRGFYYAFGSAMTRQDLVVTNGGKMQNPDSTYSDVTTGFGANYQQFGGGPSDPSNPSSKLNVPVGVPLISFGAPSAETGMSIELKSVAITRINPSPIMARIDANSGFTFVFGSGFSYGASQPPIVVDGTAYQPLATNQISRFDQNGMTNLIFNERTPDTSTEVNRFLIRGAPTPSKFDGTNAVVEVRARLLQPITDPGIAQSLTIYARDRKGNDDGANKGADEWDFNLNLNQFNTSTMTTISIPLSSFTRNATVPLGFLNLGDGLLNNFALYEFGGLIPAGGGLLKLEMEYMQIRVPPAGVPGDYNNNGIVDAADYVLWRKKLGQNVTLQNEVAGVTPGQVTAEDYAAWRARFGNTSGSGLDGAAVPEPATWLIASVAMVFIGSIHRRDK